MDHFLDRASNRQRQQLSKYYRLNGSIYIVSVEKILAGNNIYDDGSYAYVMPTERSVDIDTALDFLLAETVMNHLSK